MGHIVYNSTTAAREDNKVSTVQGSTSLKKKIPWQFWPAFNQLNTTHHTSFVVPLNMHTVLQLSFWGAMGKCTNDSVPVYSHAADSLPDAHVAVEYTISILK